MNVCFLRSFQRWNNRCAMLFFSTVLLISGSFLHVNAQTPVILNVTPNPVCQGETVTITGSHFTGATTVKLGNINASSFNIVDDANITAVVASTATDGTVAVTTPGGTGAFATSLTIKPAPTPALIHVGATDPFTNCNGNSTYQLVVSNNSSNAPAGSIFKIDWGDNTAVFTQTDWPIGAQVTHSYTAQGYFSITFTITPPNGCAKTVSYQFYNGQNPLASFTTSTSTTGLCAPAAIEFQIGNWFNNSAGTSYHINFGDGTPVVTLTHPLNPANTIQLLSHIYNTTSCPNNADFTATLQAVNGCFITTYTLNQIIIRKKPTADFTTLPSPACVTTPVCFTNTTVNGYSGNSCVATSSFVWDFGDGSPTTSSVTPPCHTYASPGTYNVTLSASNATCGSDVKTKPVVVLATSPVPVVVTPVTYCKGDAAVPLTATGTGLLWYTTSTGGTGNPTAPTPLTTNAGTITYYVSQSIAGSCESPRVPITVTVNPLPVAPAVTTPVQLCQNQTAVPLTAMGTGLLWYTAASGGAGSPTAPTPSTATPGSTTYYVSQTTNSCEGPRAAIVVTVSALALAPVVNSPISYCQNQPANPLTASPATGLLWYTVAAGGTGSSAAPIPLTTTPGSTTYYVSQVTGCGEGPRAAITVNVNPSPSASIAYSPVNICNSVSTANDPNPPIAAILTGTSGGNYSVTPATGLPVNASTGEITPSGATPGIYTIRYTIPGTGGCSNFITTAIVTVSGAPTATIKYPSPVCSTTASAAVQITGTTGGVYTSTTGLTINATTGLITPATSIPGTYTVTYTILPSAPCPGFTTSTSITITQAPSASIAYSTPNLCNVTDNASTPNPPVDAVLTGTTGGSYSITPATGLVINATTGTLTPSGATAGTYTIKYTIPGAGGCPDFVATAIVTVSGAPTATITYPSPVCSSDATAIVQRTGTPGGSYSSTTGLIINASTGAVTPAGSTPGTYMVTYIIAPSAPCPGFVTTGNITITQAPSAAISYSPAILCNVKDSVATPNPKIPVTLTGTGGGNYSITPATGLSVNATTGEITPSLATPGTYTVTYNVPAAGGCLLYKTTTAVTVSAAPTATIKYTGSPFCRGINTPQQVSATGNTGGVYSSAQGLSLNATTGAINPALSTPGVYTVTYTIAASSPCPGFVATTTVQIDDSPVLTFPLPAQSICSGGTAVYNPSSTVSSTIYSWSVTGALPVNVSGISSGTASGANAAISLSFTNTGAAAQTITIQVKPTNPSQNPCPGTPYNITLTVYPIPAALPADTFHFCMATPATALTANPSTGNTIKWYDNNFVLLNAAPVIDKSIPAQFIYYVTQSNSFGCESAKSKIVAMVHPTAKIISAAYTNPTRCGIPSGSILLDVLDLNNNPIPNIPVIVHYEKFQTAYQVLDSTDATGKITVPLVAGTYSGIYIETYGCLSQKIPDVIILKDPNPPAQPVAGYNPPICSETLLNLTAITPTSTQAGPIDYVWAGPAFGPYADTVRNTFIAFPSASVADAGTYVVYAIQNNCISATTSFQVVIKQSPSKPIISTRAPLCIGDDLVLQAYSSIPGPDPVLNYVWRGPGTGFPVNAPNAGINKVKIQDAGIYSITVSSPQTGCSSTTDTLILIGGYPIVKFAQDTLTLPTGYLLNLAPVITNATEPGILPMKNFQWTPSQDIACNDAVCSSPVATIKNNTCYNVKATNIYGCSGSAVICVKVLCQSAQIFIPNAFTPRGDVPENSKLMVRASGISSVKSFRIFNRWGKILFEKNNFPPNSTDFGWDGRVNGKLADPGVYIYIADVICENGIPYSFKGNVTLL